MTLTTVSAPTLTVADLARASGVSPATVRFYDSRGLITASRTAGNQRRFNAGDACRVKVVRVAQRIGLSVAEMQSLFASLPADPGPADWAQVSEHLRDEGRRRIHELHAALDDLVSENRLCEVPVPDRH